MHYALCIVHYELSIKHYELFRKQVASNAQHQGMADGAGVDVAHIRRFDSIAIAHSQHRVGTDAIIGKHIIGDIEAIAPPSEVCKTAVVAHIDFIVGFIVFRRKHSTHHRKRHLIAQFQPPVFQRGEIRRHSVDTHGGMDACRHHIITIVGIIEQTASKMRQGSHHHIQARERHIPPSVHRRPSKVGEQGVHDVIACRVFGKLVVDAALQHPRDARLLILAHIMICQPQVHAIVGDRRNVGIALGAHTGIQGKNARGGFRRRNATGSIGLRETAFHAHQHQQHYVEQFIHRHRRRGAFARLIGRALLVG